MFGSYLFVHLTINATLAEGARHDGSPTVFQTMVDYIHSVPFLIGVEWAFIFLPIIYHTFYGFYVMYSGQPNVLRYGYTKNWFYIFQRVTAVVLVFFLLFHVLTFKGAFGSSNGTLLAALKFEPVGSATQSTIRHLQAAWWIWAVIYPIGLLSAAFHTANGFWAAGVTWGLTISKGAQNRWGMLCIGIFLFLFAGGMVALLAGVTGSIEPVVTTTLVAH